MEEGCIYETKHAILTRKSLFYFVKIKYVIIFCTFAYLIWLALNHDNILHSSLKFKNMHNTLQKDTFCRIKVLDSGWKTISKR